MKQISILVLFIEVKLILFTRFTGAKVSTERINLLFFVFSDGQC
jgi:hypothetical protein